MLKLPKRSNHARRPYDRRPFVSVWQILIILCLLLGLVYRVVNLDAKLYTYDEAFTALRYSGYTEAEAIQNLTSQNIVSNDQLQKFQHINPQHNAWDTVQGLMQEEPQITPLYFVLGRYWAGLWGSSIASIRSLSVLFSLLTLPCLWWLCQELFAARVISALAIALFAVSPMQILYAQDARFYSLWTLLTILSSAALLRAMRVQTRTSWGLYALASIASVYTSFLAVLVGLAQFFTVAILEPCHWSRSLRRTVMALCAAALSIAPWFRFVVDRWSHVQKLMEWAGKEYYVGLQYGRQLVGQLSLGFFDLDRETLPADLGARIGERLGEVFILGIVSYGFYRVCRTAPHPARVLVTLLALLPALLLIGADLTLGGWRALIPRYMVPAYLASLIAVAYGLAHSLSSATEKTKQQFGRVALAILLSLSILSGAWMTQAETWWNKEGGNYTLAIAAVIHQSPRPLIISNASFADILVLHHALNSHLNPQALNPQTLNPQTLNPQTLNPQTLNPQVAWLIRPQCYSCTLHQDFVNQPPLPARPTEYSDIFLFQPDASERWLERIQQHWRYPLQSVPEAEGWLWRVNVF